MSNRPTKSDPWIPSPGALQKAVLAFYEPCRHPEQHDGVQQRVAMKRAIEAAWWSDHWKSE